MSNETTEVGDGRNHGCEFPWCESQMGSCDAQRLEHILAAEHVPATARSLSLPSDTDPDDCTWPTVGFGIHFNEDLEAAPVVFLHVTGGWQERDVDADLRIDEAVMLHAVLGKMIQLASAGTGIDADRVLRFYGGGDYS